MSVKMIELDSSSFKNISTLVDSIDDELHDSASGFYTTDNFYRGVSNIEHQLVPSLYREGMEGVNEGDIFRHFRLQHPRVSSSYPDDWELMSFLRHNGYPVRLLDFTHNVLVALYFACANDEDREIDSGLYIIKKSPGITFIPGGEVSVDMDKWRRESYHVQSVQELIDALGINDPKKCKLKFQPVVETPYSINQNPSLYDLGDLIHGAHGLGRLKGLSEILTNAGVADEITDLHFLHYFISTENQIYLKCLSLNNGRYPQCQDLSMDMLAFPHFIEPPVSNPRVRAQSGLFLVAGGTKKNGKYGLVHPLLPFDEHIDGVKVRIPAAVKEGILKELSRYNVAQHTLFPEVDHQISHILKLAGKAT